MKSITGKPLIADRSFGVTIYRDEDGDIELLNSFSTDWDQILVAIHENSDDAIALDIAQSASPAIMIQEIEKVGDIADWADFLAAFMPIVGNSSESYRGTTATRFDLYWIFGDKLSEIAAGVTRRECDQYGMNYMHFQDLFDQGAFSDMNLSNPGNYRLARVTKEDGDIETPQPREFKKIIAKVPAPEAVLPDLTADEIAAKFGVLNRTAERLKNISTMVSDLDGKEGKMTRSQKETHTSLKTQLREAMRRIEQESKGTA
jgi:hypothetical protein